MTKETKRCGWRCAKQQGATKIAMEREQALTQERMEAICRLAEERFGETAAARLSALLEGAALPLLPEGEAPRAETPPWRKSRSPNTSRRAARQRRL